VDNVKQNLESHPHLNTGMSIFDFTKNSIKREEQAIALDKLQSWFILSDDVKMYPFQRVNKAQNKENRISD
jgi:hypothetical protein